MGQYFDLLTFHVNEASPPKKKKDKKKRQLEVRKEIKKDASIGLSGPPLVTGRFPRIPGHNLGRHHVLSTITAIFMLR